MLVILFSMKDVKTFILGPISMYTKYDSSSSNYLVKHFPIKNEFG